METTAEIVEETPSSTNSDLESLGEKNEAIKMAITGIKDHDEEVTNASLIDELFDRYNFGDIDEDQYYEAKKVLGM